jgi:hypothetical protein
LRDVCGHAVGNVDAPLGHVYVSEEVLVHVEVVRARVVGGEPDVFVEIEGLEATEIEAARAVSLDQGAIEQQLAAPGSEAQDGARLTADEVRDDSGGQGARRLGGRLDDHLHAGAPGAGRSGIGCRPVAAEPRPHVL